MLRDENSGIFGGLLGYPPPPPLADNILSEKLSADLGRAPPAPPTCTPFTDKIRQTTFNLISPKAEKRGLEYERIYKYKKGISREECV